MHLFVQATIVGILFGGVYALIAGGQAIIFGVTRTVNFAQAILVILCSYLSYTLFSDFGVDPFLSILVLVPAMFAFGYGINVLLLRRLSRSGTPVSWGIRLFNGKGEQQITILLPNPFLHPETDKILKVPDWSRLALWDHLRARWFDLPDPDPFDRSGRGFRHD